jgi:6,7-dimethyl-8-ribityllumazine synthase
VAGRAPAARAGVTAAGRRVAVVASRFHEALTRRLVEGARAVLRRHGVRDRDLAVVWVPGAFELPQVALRLARGGGVDAIVCVGCVIRGETPHFDYVAGEAARGIGEVARLTGLPVTFGVITANTPKQAEARAGGPAGNRGEEAALAAVELLGLFDTLRPARRRRAGR